MKYYEIGCPDNWGLEGPPMATEMSTEISDRNLGNIFENETSFEKKILKFTIFRAPYKKIGGSEIQNCFFIEFALVSAQTW